MHDNLTPEQLVAQMQKLTPEQKAEIAQRFSDTPEIPQQIAKTVRAELIAALSQVIGQEAAQHLSNARRQIDRQNAIHVSLSPAGAKRRMSDEQMAEYFRVTCHRMAGKPAEVNQDLDEGGLITQSLTGVTGSAGGYAIPEDFDTMIHTRAERTAVLWPLIQVDPTSRDVVKGFEITGFITPNVGGSAKSRSATSTENITVTEPVFSEVSWTMRTMDARVPIKLDLLDDSPIALLNLVTRLASDGFVRKREAYVASGTGAAGSLPVGLFNAEGGITAVAVTDVNTLAKIAGFVDDLPVDYRKNATLIAGTVLIFKVASTLATTVYSPEFLRDILPPMKESADIPAGKMLVGDMKRYIVKRNVLMRMVQSVAAERWTLEIAMQEKWDGKPVVTDAFRIGNVTSY